MRCDNIEIRRKIEEWITFLPHHKRFRGVGNSIHRLGMTSGEAKRGTRAGAGPSRSRRGIPFVHFERFAKEEEYTALRLCLLMLILQILATWDIYGREGNRGLATDEMDLNGENLHGRNQASTEPLLSPYSKLGYIDPPQHLLESLTRTWSMNAAARKKKGIMMRLHPWDGLPSWLVVLPTSFFPEETVSRHHGLPHRLNCSSAHPPAGLVSVEGELGSNRPLPRRVSCRNRSY